MIKYENNKYVVYSESGRRFGSYSNEKDAKHRLAQMELFKHMNKTAKAVKLKNFFSTEPSCVVLGAGTQCATGKSPSFTKKAGFKFPKHLYGELKGIEQGSKSILREKFGPAYSEVVQNEKLLKILKSIPNKTDADISHIMKVTNRINNKTKQMYKEQHMLN